MKKLLLSALFASCATTPAPVASARPLESSPTKAPLRQLPAALDVDPTKLTPAPLALTLREPEIVALPNGLTVYFLADHSTPLVNLRLMVPTGAFDDPPQQVGRAVLTTSLMREGGAGALAPGALEALLEFSAADLGAGSGDEASTVSLSLRAAELPKLFPIFADVVQRPRFDEQRFPVQRDRLLEALRRRDDRPDGVVERALWKAVFGPTTLLGREPTVATVSALTVADLRANHSRNWGPQGARLVITGDVTREVALALATTHFGAWKGGAPPARSFEPQPALPTRVFVVPRKLAQAKVRIGTWGFKRATPAEFPLRLANTALGTFGVGRLNREIRDARGLAYSTWSSVSGGPTTGLFTAGFDTRPEQVGEALEVATKILHGMATDAPPSEAELATAKDMALNAFAFRFDSAAKIASERASFDLAGYPADYLSTWREHLSAVDAALAARAARQLGEGLQIVVVGPPEKLGDLSRFGPVSTITDVEQFR